MRNILEQCAITGITLLALVGFGLCLFVSLLIVSAVPMDQCFRVYFEPLLPV